MKASLLCQWKLCNGQNVQRGKACPSPFQLSVLLKFLKSYSFCRLKVETGFSERCGQFFYPLPALSQQKKQYLFFPPNFWCMLHCWCCNGVWRVGFVLKWRIFSCVQTFICTRSSKQCLFGDFVILVHLFQLICAQLVGSQQVSLLFCIIFFLKYLSFKFFSLILLTSDLNINPSKMTQIKTMFKTASVFFPFLLYSSSPPHAFITLLILMSLSNY